MATTATSATTGTGSGLIQSLGIGSGLNVASLVTQLVGAERAASDSRITRQANQVGTQISALGSLKGAVSSFQAVVNSVTGLDSYRLKSAGSADATVFTASAGPTAVAGTYPVSVQQLAQGAQLLSKNFTAGSAAVVGTGALTIARSTGNFSVAIDSGNNTLAGIRDAINASPDNIGVKASLVYGTGGAQLVLSSSSTGADSSFTVATSGGDGGLAALTYAGAGDTSNYSVSQAAQDAIVLVAGVEAHSASNTVTTAIDGVTLNLVAAKKDTPLNLTVSSNDSGVLLNAQKLLKAYNAMVTSLAPLGSYDATSQSAGPMLGDSLLGSVTDQLRRGMFDPVAGVNAARNTLSAIGVKTAFDGTLTLDVTRFQAALTADPNGVAQLFGGTGGVATRLSTKLEGLLGTGSAIAARDSNLTASQKDITAQQTALDARMAVVQQRYLTQFNALDQLMSQMQSTAGYLTQQLSSSLQLANYTTASNK